MAVINDYVNTNLRSTSTRQRVPGYNAQGGRTTRIQQTFEVAAADDDTSVYRVFANIPATAIFTSLRLMCDAIAGATSYSCGIYMPKAGGAVVDPALFASAVDISAGYSRILAKDFLVAVDIANINKTIWELAVISGYSATTLAYTVQNFPRAFDICLTANTVGTAAGTISMVGEYYLAA